MRSQRQEEIIKIISNKDIETQEELAEELRESGYEVTQATVSRDIKTLKLTKVLGDEGRYTYAAMNRSVEHINNKMKQILANTILDVEAVDKFVVVKTLSGSGSAAGEAIDTLDFPDIAGTIAGDNTIFILVREEETAKQIVDVLKEFIL